MDNNTVLVVEDDSTLRDLVVATLEDSFNMIEAEDAETAIALAQKHKPIVALVDLYLENNSSGKEVCAALKSDSAGDQPCGVIFLSGTIEENIVLECYEMGADDFVPKPFSIKSLRKKVEAVASHQQLVWKLKSSEHELEDMVGTTMNQASSYGSALNAVKAMSYINQESALARCFFDFWDGKGIFTALNFKHQSNPCFFDSSHEQVSPIEEEVFVLTRSKGRFFTFGNRLIVNDQHVSILVKNPPKLDEEDYGIFIDIIAVFIEALEARYVAIINERKILEAQIALSTLVHDVKATIAGIQKSKQELVDKIVSELGLSFHQLDMTQEQEEFFNTLIENTVLTHDAGNSEFIELGEKLEEAARHLTIEEHRSLEPEENSHGSGHQDIDLF